MGENNSNSNLDFDTDAEFTKNFYRNIDKAISDDNEAKECTGEENIYISEDVEKTHAGKLPAVSTVFAQENLDNVLGHINASLAEQISHELDEAKPKIKKKKSGSTKVLAGVALALFVVLGFSLFLGFTAPGRKILLRFGINLGGMIWENRTAEFEKTVPVAASTDPIQTAPANNEKTDINPDTGNAKQEPVPSPVVTMEGRHEDYAYNILLLGEEAIDSGTSNGRTDLIIIATLNTKDRTVKLTSLMRDMLVKIPGYQDNKINTAYEKGGIDLVYETITKNFDVKLDGSILVNFENFERIIDSLGGLSITLTAGEADYLNHTNYISKPQYRNVTEGTQLMNGNQVLGYSRIRKISTLSGNNNDYGRTDRHRTILNAVFDKYKTTDKVKLASVMYELLPMLTTDINSDTFKLLLNTYIDIGVTRIQQLRIPANHTFKDDIQVRDLEDVLVPDIDKNLEILHNFIFGDIKSN